MLWEKRGGVFVQHLAIPDKHFRSQAIDDFYNIAFKLFPFQNCGVRIVQRIGISYRLGMKITISITCKRFQKWYIYLCAFGIKCLFLLWNNAQDLYQLRLFKVWIYFLNEMKFRWIWFLKEISPITVSLEA